MRIGRALLALAAAVVVAAAPAAAQPVPPPAPSPTDSGSSPKTPDPHPPLGGRGPDGAAVGGAALLSRGEVLPAGAPALPAGLTARAWILVDLDRGTVLAARDPHGRYQPASILKLLTAVTLLPLLPGGERVTVSAAAANTEGSHAGLVPNGRYTVDQLFEGLLLVSGNDTAEALAAAAGGRAETVALMNRQAMLLGAYDTYAQTPSGLDGWQQLTSAYDMALVLRAALAQPRFVAYDRMLTATLPAQPRILDAQPLENQNAYLFTHVPSALVAKTGYTDAALHTFAGAFERDGRRLGVIFLRAQRYPTDQWQQALRLADWGFALPATTRVGTLIRPPAPTAPTSAPAPAERLAAAQPGSSGDPALPLAAWALTLAAVAVAAFAVRSRRARRRPRRRSQPGSQDVDRLVGATAVGGVATGHLGGVGQVGDREAAAGEQV